MRKSDMVYFSQTGENSFEYIQVFKKNPKISLEQEIIKNHLSK